MSHVDDGTLHALVDDALDVEERRQVEAHLASCGDCARRFAEATSMARQVHALLGTLDDVGGATHAAPVAAAPAVAPEPVAVPGVTPLHRTKFPLRRIALAASLLVVAGISYQVGQINKSESRSTFERVALETPQSASPRPSLPSIVDAPQGSEPSISTLRARARTEAAPQRDAERAIAGAADSVVASDASAARGARADVSTLPPAPASPPQASAEQRNADEPRRRSAEASAEAVTQQRAQVAARADQSQAPSAQSQTQSRYSIAAASAPVAAVPEQAKVGGNVASKPNGTKAVPLAGYTAIDEESTSAMTRRRYVSTAGTSLLLLITQPLAEGKAQMTAADASEFTVTTSNGRGTVRWQQRGLNYELQGALAPDSLVKLATLLK